MFFLTLFLVIFTSVFLASVLRINHRPGYLLAVFLIGMTNIVISGLLGHFFSTLNNQIYFLFLEFFFAVSALAFWAGKKRPSLLGPWQNVQDILPRNGWRKNFRDWRIVWVLAVFVLTIYILGAFQIFLLPPNTNDSLLNHLARVGYWLQHGNMSLWPTPSTHNIIYPVNGNLLFLWTMLFTHGDNLTGFVQWSAAWASALAIYSIARLLGWAKPHSLFAGLLWLTLPEIYFQSTTTQQDLFVAALFIISIYFLIYGLINQNWVAILYSSLAFGLSIGSKQIVLFAIPGLVLFLVLVNLIDRTKYRYLLLKWMLFAAIFTLTLGSFIYFQNIKAFGNPLGDKESLSIQIQGRNKASLAEKFLYNNSRLFYQSIDFSGFPQSLSNDLIRLKVAVFKPVFELARLNLESPTAVQNIQAPFSYMAVQKNQEDESWYGLIGLLLLIPISIIQLILGIKQKNPFRIGLVLMAYTFWLMVAVFRPGWELFEGRYLMISFGLLSPFYASLLRRNLVWKILDWLIVGYVAITSVILILNNQAKPLLSYPRVQSLINANFPDLPKTEKQKIFELVQVNIPAATDIWNSTRTRNQLRQTVMMEEPVRLVTTFIKEDASIALGFSTYLPVFPLFGDHFTRKLFPVYPPETLLDKSWFQNNKIDFLLLYLSDPQMPNPPSWLIPYRTQGNWALYYPEWNKPATP
jgi:hypothetical protein